MFNHMIGNITKIRLRAYICASSDVFLPSISSLKQLAKQAIAVVYAPNMQMIDISIEGVDKLLLGLSPN